MKLILISFTLLLFLLVLTQSTNSPSFKMLFQPDGENGYHITESFETRLIEYEYWSTKDGRPFFFFAAKRQDSTSDSMFLRRDRMYRSPGFAIVSQPLGFYSNQSNCVDNSTYELQHIISSCTYDLILRPLTTEEKVQIEQYKAAQKVSRKPFEMLYQGKQAIIKSAQKIDELKYKDTILANEFHNLSFNATINGQKSWLKINDRLVDRSLVIEGLTEESEEECVQPGLEDLKMIECKGKLKVKPN